MQELRGIFTDAGAGVLAPRHGLPAHARVCMDPENDKPEAIRTARHPKTKRAVKKYTPFLKKVIADVPMM